MNRHTAAKWERRRKMGRSKFMLYHTIGSGLGFAVLLSLVEWATQGAVDYRWVVVRFCFFASIGFMYGAFMWTSRETGYQAYKNPGSPK
jgi:hypothetical protein